MRQSLLLGLFIGHSLAYDQTLGFRGAPQVETRSIDKIYKAALAEGGVVTTWQGGDEKNQRDSLKAAFEKAFPGMTLNVTVDVSKYHDGKIDEQLARNKVYVDSVMLQTLHDFPRWAEQGALLKYAPRGFEDVHPAFKDSLSAAWYGVEIVAWSFIWNSEKLPGVKISEFDDFLKPEFKNKLVLTYPNDDDAVLFAFELAMQRYGTRWFDALLKQNPRWVRGSATPVTLALQDNTTSALTFTSFVGFQPPAPLKISFPTKGQFVSWPQTAAILKDAPHPEGAKLFHNFLLSRENVQSQGWNVGKLPPPAGFPYPGIVNMSSTNPTAFARFMADRPRVERLKLWFEDRLGTPQGLSPLNDDL